MEILEKTPIDILLTDVGLPDVSGMVLARKAREGRPDLQIVIATGDDSAADQAHAIEAKLLLKPFLSSDLVRVLQTE